MHKDEAAQFQNLRSFCKGILRLFHDTRSEIRCAPMLKSLSLSLSLCPAIILLVAAFFQICLTTKLASLKGRVYVCV
jgi:hypothetical protein